MHTNDDNTTMPIVSATRRHIPWPLVAFVTSLLAFIGAIQYAGPASAGKTQGAASDAGTGIETTNRQVVQDWTTSLPGTANDPAAPHDQDTTGPSSTHDDSESGPATESPPAESAVPTTLRPATATPSAPTTQAPNAAQSTAPAPATENPDPPANPNPSYQLVGPPLTEFEAWLTTTDALRQWNERIPPDDWMVGPAQALEAPYCLPVDDTMVQCNPYIADGRDGGGSFPSSRFAYVNWDGSNFTIVGPVQ